MGAVCGSQGRTVGHSRPISEQQRASGVLMPGQGLWQKPWHPLQLKHWWDFLSRSGFALMKRFKCPQGENEKKKREKERVVMH